MIDRLETLVTLAERPSSPPEPISELRRRVETRRRHRSRRRIAFTAMVAGAVAVAIVVPLLRRSGTRRVSVSGAAGRPATGGPATGRPGTTAATRKGGGVPYQTHLEYSLPAGWQTLFSQDDEMVVSTEALSPTDVDLARLARDDVAFDAFPTAAVVVVVGADPVEAKYSTGPNGSLVAPGPAYDLGPQTVLPGGVTVRRGDIPSSVLRIASYAGATAPAVRVQQAQTIAQGIRLVATGDPSVPGPPPPAGSSQGFPTGSLPISYDDVPAVATSTFAEMSLTLKANGDCAYLGLTGANQPLAGACTPRPLGPTVSVAGNAILVEGPPPPPTGVATSTPYVGSGTAVLFRLGPGVDAVTAQFAEGGSVAGIVGADGWGFAVGEGRIFALTGTDTTGRSLPQVFVR